MAKISKFWAREILDSRGIPTIEAACILDNGMVSVASIPAGTSTGTHEALELRDTEDPRYKGKGVLIAIRNVNEILAPAIVGMDPTHQYEIDQKGKQFVHFITTYFFGDSRGNRSGQLAFRKRVGPLESWFGIIRGFF